MKNAIITLRLSILIVGCTVASTTLAQQQEQEQEQKPLQQQVEVSKAFRPSISDAFKINFNPQVDDTVRVKPRFDYNILSRAIMSAHNIVSMPAAKLSAIPQPEIGVGYLKGGMGSFLTPYAELFLNKRRSKTSAFGVHYSHYSSHGKITLENDQKTDAPYSHNAIAVFSKRYGEKSVFSTDMDYTRNHITYYGYPGSTTIPVDNLGNYCDPTQGTRQVFDNASLMLQLSSIESQRSSFAYNIGVTGRYFATLTNQSEFFGGATINLSKNYGELSGILNGELFYVKTENTGLTPGTTLDGRQSVFARINPALVFKINEGTLRIGFNTTTILDDNSDAEFKVAPNILAEWYAIEDILSVYIKADGYVDAQLMNDVFAENPYRDPQYQLRNSEYRYIAEGGFKGNINAKTSFMINASYADIKDLHFYFLTELPYSEPSNPSVVSQTYIKPTFTPEYCDTRRLKISGEVLHSSGDNFHLSLKSNYYNYTRDDGKDPYNRPEFDLTFSSRFSPREQWIFNIDLFAEGGREQYIDLYLPSSTPVSPEKENIVDLTLGATYKYTGKTHFWGKVKNALFGTHERWMGYREAPFNVMVGMSYSF